MPSSLPFPNRLLNFIEEYEATSTSVAALKLLDTSSVHRVFSHSKNSIAIEMEGRFGPHKHLLSITLPLNKAVYAPKCRCYYVCEHVCLATMVLFRECARLGKITPLEHETAAREVLAVTPSPNAPAIQWDLQPDHAKILFGNQAVPREIQPLFDAESQWWLAFLELQSVEARSDFLHKLFWARFPKAARRHHYSDCISVLAENPNPAAALAEFPRIAESIFVLSGLRIAKDFWEPPFLNYLQSPEHHDKIRQGHALLTTRKMCQWLDLHASPSNESILPNSIEVSIASVRVPAGPLLLAFRVLFTSTRLQRSPRTAQNIDSLAREVERDQKRLPAVQEEFVRSFYSSRYGHSSLINQVSEDPFSFKIIDFNSFFSNWGARGFVRWDDTRNEVLFAPENARLQLAHLRDDEWQWQIQAPDPQTPAHTVPIPLAEAQIYVESTWRNDPDAPPKVFLRQADTLRRVNLTGIPNLLWEHAFLVPEFRAQELHLNKHASAWATHILPFVPEDQRNLLVREIPAEITLRLRLSESRLLSVQARAQCEDGNTLWLHAPGRWAKAAKPTSSPSSSKAKIIELEWPDSEKPEDLELIPVSTETDTNTLPQDHANTPPACASSQDDPDPPPAPIPAPLQPVQRNEFKPLASALRPDDIAPTEQWIHAIAPSQAAYAFAFDNTPSIEWNLNDAALSLLLNAWPNRPHAVRYEANRTFANLVLFRQAPKLKIRVESSGIDWFGVSVEMEGEMQAISIKDIRRILTQSKNSFVILPGGRVYRREDLEQYTRQTEALAQLGMDAAPGQQRVHAMQLSALAQPDAFTAEMESVAAQAWSDFLFRAREMAKNFQGVPTSPVSDHTAAFLRPYQRQGADFLAWAGQNFGGALLADDMGLGKTLQVLAAITALQTLKHSQKLTSSSYDGKIPSLVVCPASVAHNWMREAARFAPSLRVLVLERGAARKAQIQQIDSHDLVVTNYALLRRDAQALASRQWLMLCADEAQAIKNPQSESAAALKQLNAHYRIALTGTPIENRLTDLWSILDFAVPGHLGSRSDIETEWRADPQTLASRLRARLKPILLRRIKREVAPELPPRIEERRDCEMSPGQRRVYLAELKKTRLMLEGVKGETLAGPDRILILAALTRLRQICCDPALLGIESAPSGKIQELMEFLPGLLEAGHKVLLFSQFVRMLEHIQVELDTLSIPHFLLTGQTTQRPQVVDAFQNHPEPCVFLISLKAGGVGLNLTAASHVILFDPWWNPAVEAQAIDRTHRIGQDKTILAFRLVTSDTIEERILELQDRKRAMVENLLAEEAFNSTLTREDFAFLLRD